MRETPTLRRTATALGLASLAYHTAMPDAMLPRRPLPTPKADGK